MFKTIFSKLLPVFCILCMPMFVNLLQVPTLLIYSVITVHVFVDILLNAKNMCEIEIKSKFN